MKRLAALLFWSAISAAFIGPGTVTTCARAGAEHGLTLAWALAFSTLACWALQEASARVTIASGRPLADALAARRFGGGAWAARLVVGAVVIGCAAYEAGNIVGAAVGAGLVTGAPLHVLVFVCGGIAAAGLIAGSPRALAYALGAVVVVMGVAFAACAAAVGPSPLALAGAIVSPRTPPGSQALVLGLIGTTVVPYNLFLGSGLARGRDLDETRGALGVAIVAGGAISLAILVVGTAVDGAFSFDSVATAMQRVLGERAGALFGVGLLAAGLSSAMTAPLAAGLAVSSLLPRGESRRARTARLVAAGVLVFGLAFGLTGARPVRIIVAAQALNGLLLPFVAIFLLVAANDRGLVGRRGLSGPLSNLACGMAVSVTLVLGLRSLLGALATATGYGRPDDSVALLGGVVLALVGSIPITRAIRRGRMREAG